MGNFLEQSFGLERIRYIVADEFEALLKACRKDPRAYAAFYTKGNLGLRVGELVSLTPQQLHPDRRDFTILTLKQKKRNKKGELKPPAIDTVPADPDVLQNILTYAKSIDCGPAERIWPYTTRTVMNWWTKYAKKAGLYIAGTPAGDDGFGAKRGRGIHCLRHFKAFHAKQAGAELKTTAQLLRHRSIASTMIYWHTEDLRKTVETIGAIGTWPSNGKPVGPSSAKPSSTGAGARPRRKRRSARESS